MKSFFYNLGRMVGPKVRKSRWVWESLTGTEEDAIAAEHEIGRDLAAEVRAESPPGGDPRDQALIDGIASSLTPCVRNRLRRFSFETIQQAEPNAFAVPGGFIFITHALLDMCERNRDEIAFVLGHEMAHVIKRHAIDRVISSSAIAAASRTTPLRGVVGGWVRSVGVQFLESAYSRERELDADGLGVRLAEAAGYDPRGGMRLLSRLAVRSRETGIPAIPYFASHPPCEDRIAGIEKLLRR